MKLFIVAVLLLTAGLSAGDKTPFAIADLYRIKYISDPQISKLILLFAITPGNFFVIPRMDINVSG